MRDFPPTHPGEILLEEFLKPMGITQYTFIYGETVATLIEQRT